MSLSIRDQSQVRGFSAWSELNYFVYRKLSSWDAFFKWYHSRAKWNIFTVIAPAANTTNIDYKQSLIFLLLTVCDKQWSVSCEYTRPFILQPHQAPWWSQGTEHWPTWDANNESKGARIINNCQNALPHPSPFFTFSLSPTPFDAFAFRLLLQLQINRTTTLGTK